MTEYRSFDGYGNNLTQPDWGRSGTPLFRHPGLAAYVADGHTPSGADRPNPRDISDIVCAEADPGTANAAGRSDYVWAWGQFLDHELDLSGGAEPAESLDIDVRPGSHPKLPDKPGVIPVNRSRYDPSTGGHGGNPREQINEHTSYIDGSNVYGPTPDRAAVLRAYQDGKLKASTLKNHKHALLPKNTFDLPNDHGPGRPGITRSDFFVAGDIRVNEHVVLTCMHTLFLREHNSLCDRLRKELKDLLGPLPAGAQDELLFQEARRRVVAKMQVITFKEFLPALLGPGAISSYRGYNANVNSSVSNFFAHSAYRLGHSMVSPVLRRIPLTGKAGELRLEEAFWRPALFDSSLVDGLLNGLWQQRMREVDTRTVDGLRNHLFRSQISGAPDRVLDLAALNIQRGRDHGFPGYNQCREALGLAPKRNLRAVTTNNSTRGRLRHAYDNDVNLIDPWIGGLAEDHVDGAQVGELVYHALREQFERLRDGDRFWYQSLGDGFTSEQVAELEQATLAQVIRDNTNVDPGTDDVFRVVDP